MKGGDSNQEDEPEGYCGFGLELGGLVLRQKSQEEREGYLGED